MSERTETLREVEAWLPSAFAYLDSLRESDITNMYGAGPYVENAFPDLTAEQVSAVVIAWMRSFSKEPPEVRARAALTSNVEGR